MDEETFNKILDRSFVDVQHDSPDFKLMSFAEWLTANQDRIFRFWVYKRMFTPYEKNEKFMDESIYEDDYCERAYIKEAMELPDGDILIGFQNASFPKEYLEYYKLSEIRLAYMADDKEDLDEDEGLRRM